MSEGPRYGTLLEQMGVWQKDLQEGRRRLVHQAPDPQDAPKHATLLEKIAADLGQRQGS